MESRAELSGEAFFFPAAAGRGHFIFGRSIFRKGDWFGKPKLWTDLTVFQFPQIASAVVRLEFRINEGLV